MGRYEYRGGSACETVDAIKHWAMIRVVANMGEL